jgi:hypothetical protein
MKSGVGAHLRGNAVGYVALFLALGLGTAWALDANSVRSKHIVNDQVKGVDVAERTLGIVPEAKSAQPKIFGNINIDGSLDTALSKGIKPSNVVFDEPDQYCFKGLRFRPRGGQLTPDYDEVQTAVNLQLGIGPIPGCPAGTQAFVWQPDGLLGFFFEFYR